MTEQNEIDYGQVRPNPEGYEAPDRAAIPHVGIYTAGKARFIDAASFIFYMGRIQSTLWDIYNGAPYDQVVLMATDEGWEVIVHKIEEGEGDATSTGLDSDRVAGAPEGDGDGASGDGGAGA